MILLISTFHQAIRTFQRSDPWIDHPPLPDHDRRWVHEEAPQFFPRFARAGVCSVFCKAARADDTSAAMSDAATAPAQHLMTIRRRKRASPSIAPSGSTGTGSPATEKGCRSKP